MLKIIIAATIAMVARADINNFPSFDAFHANCAIDVIYPGQTCASVYNNMMAVLTKWQAGDPGKGIYAFKEVKEGTYIWVTRTTPVKKYVDDIAFEFTQSTGADCTVNSRSRSQTLSYYDYSTNYCNMWNPITYTGKYANLVYKSCPFPADDPATVCLKY
jgi:hypothetical protein